MADPTDPGPTVAPVIVTAPSPSAGPRIPGLQQASWRGVPFGVVSADGAFGRRVKLHEYPLRDKPWVEDLGRAARRISITGFLVADSLVYGGGDAVSQREKMIQALEGQGSGILIHPTLGSLKVSLAEPAVITERWDADRYYELQLRFIESGQASFPSNAVATQPASLASAALADLAAAADFSSALTPLLPLGGLTVASAVAAVTNWGAGLGAAGADASSLINFAAQLVAPAGSTYGRYFNGALGGALGALTAAVLPASTTLDQLAAGAALDRSVLASAAATVATLTGELGLPGASPTDIALAVQTNVAALAQTAANPADAIRLLAGLADYSAASSAAVGPAIDNVFQRAIGAALARAAAAYNPSSYDDAANIRATVTGALDALIETAGDSGEDASFNALYALKSAVGQDLIARGATLAPMVSFRFNRNLPSLVLSNRIYRDARRAGQLVGEADPPNPLFMPTDFQALAI